MKNTGNGWWMLALLALGLAGAMWGVRACGSGDTGSLNNTTTHTITLKGATS